MQDTELYRELLGLKTQWRGTGVELEVKERPVDSPHCVERRRRLDNSVTRRSA
jgi:hypothetical protein